MLFQHPHRFLNRTLKLRIAPGHYLYRDKLTFRVDGNIELEKEL